LERLLVFAGTGAIVINEVSRGAITHVGIALVAPVLGATAATLACRCVRESDCCTKPETVS